MKNLYLSLIIVFISCNQSNDIKDIELKNKTTVTDSLDSKIADSFVDSIILNKYWIDKNITSATLYCYLPEAKSHSKNLILDENLKLNSTIIDSLTFELDSSSVDYFKKYLFKQTNFMEEWVAGCFEPHHGLVLKNYKKEIVGHLSFCFECNQYRLKPEHANYIPMEVFRKICKKAKVPTKRGDIMNLYYKQNKKK